MASILSILGADGRWLPSVVHQRALLAGFREEKGGGIRDRVENRKGSPRRASIIIIIIIVNILHAEAGRVACAPRDISV